MMRNPRCLVAVQLYKHEPLLGGLEQRNKSRLLTLGKQFLGDLFTALSMSHKPKGS